MRSPFSSSRCAAPPRWRAPLSRRAPARTTSWLRACPPPFGDFGPTGYIYPTDGSPGGVGRCEDLPNGQSVVFTVTGEWPCAAPQTPEPTAAPTPHHHHHDAAVADFRDAALGSLVVAALTAAVLI